MVKISVTSKLDGIRSWSLQAGDTCPASYNSDGSLVDACKGCYAKSGNYRFQNVKAPREFNREDWKRDAWVDDMVKALDSDRYFRWFDSGDMYAIGLAEKIYEVMQRTQWVKHWLPTRMYKFPKFLPVLQLMRALPNVVVRYSSDSVQGETLGEGYGLQSVIVPDSSPDSIPVGASLCRAYESVGKCNGCRACWDKSVELVAYPAHGKSMAKVIRLKVVA